MSLDVKRRLITGTRIRVLVVDDSVVIRRLVRVALEEDPLIEVVGAAANGQIALKMIPQLSPDVITLDIEMPVMDGLETLRHLRKEYPRIRVIMFSTLTRHGGESTLEALALGASDYATKAANVGSLGASLQCLRDELVPKIKQFFSLTGERPPQTAPAAFPRQPRATLSPRVTRKVVVIGVSTGGPTALAVLMPMFPPGFPLPVLIVQHMPPVFTQLLAERLQTQTKLRVSEAVENAPVERGAVLIAPGNFHMRVVRKAGAPVVTLNQDPPQNSCRPAADVLFHSSAEVFGAATVSVVLTGMGQDGLRGVETLKSAGAYVIAQDEASSVVWGMPGFVAKAGLADAVVDLKCVVPEILKQI